MKMAIRMTQTHIANGNVQTINVATKRQLPRPFALFARTALGQGQTKNHAGEDRGELPLAPQQRTGPDGSDPLNVCATGRLMHCNKLTGLAATKWAQNIPRQAQLRIAHIADE